MTKPSATFRDGRDLASCLTLIVERKNTGSLNFFYFKSNNKSRVSLVLDLHAIQYTFITIMLLVLYAVGITKIEPQNYFI